MKWLTNFFTSSIGRKLVMSLTGLFLILFLVIHLIGNLQLMHDDGGEAFNLYAKFMTSFPPIKAVSYLLYISIVVHAVQGLVLWAKNRKARGSDKYAVKVTRATRTSAFASTRMGALGTIILIFILLHMYQFWLQMKLGNTPMAMYDGVEVKDLYVIVNEAYQNIGYVVFYVVSMLFIAIHLWHGFQSAFQSLGLYHTKYSPTISLLGKVYSVVVPALFAVIPIYMYLMNR